MFSFAPHPPWLFTRTSPLAAWRDDTWEERRAWRLNVRADYFHKVQLLRFVFQSWAARVRLLRKRRKVRVWQAWRRYTALHLRLATLQAGACAASDRLRLRHTFARWQWARIEQQRRRSLEAEAHLAVAHAKMGAAWQQWRVAFESRRERQRRTWLADYARDRLLLRRMLVFWREKTHRLHRLRLQAQCAAEQLRAASVANYLSLWRRAAACRIAARRRGETARLWRRASLLGQCLQRWKQHVKLCHEQVARGEQLRRTREEARLGRAWERWRAHFSRISLRRGQAILASDAACKRLLSRAWTAWRWRYDATAEARLVPQLRQWHQMQRVLTLRRGWALWCRAFKATSDLREADRLGASLRRRASMAGTLGRWRRAAAFQRLQRARTYIGQEWAGRRKLALALQHWRMVARHWRRLRQDQEKADKARRRAQLGHWFWLWRQHSNELWQQRELKARALRHFLSGLQTRAWHGWRTYTLEQRSQRHRHEDAGQLRRLTLLAEYWVSWRSAMAQCRTQRRKEAVADAFATTCMLWRVWPKWRAAAAEAARERQARRAAEDARARQLGRLALWRWRFFVLQQRKRRLQVSRATTFDERRLCRMAWQRWQHAKQRWRQAQTQAEQRFEVVRNTLDVQRKRRCWSAWQQARDKRRRLRSSAGMMTAIVVRRRLRQALATINAAYRKRRRLRELERRLVGGRGGEAREKQKEAS